MRTENRLPALVLGSGITALGVVRALGRKGVQTFSASATPGVEKRSRWYQEAPGLHSGELRVSLAEYLGGSPLDRAVLVPCSDELVLETAGLQGDLADGFPTCVPPSDALEILIDKGKFHEALVSAGVPHPTTYLPEDPLSLAGLFEPGDISVFVKPRLSHRFFDRYGVKGKRPGSPGEYRALAQELGDQGIEFIVQEYVPGPASNHYFLDGFVAPDGQVKARFARNRLRMYPPDYGNSSLMISVSLEEVGDALGPFDKLLRSVGYKGVFSAEFKRDERDGVLRLLEVNARPWWFIEFAARCGVDVAYMAYVSASGEEVGPVASYRTGQVLTHPYYDYHACKVGSPSFPGAMAKFIGPLFRGQQPVFCWDDPMPGLAASVQLTADFFGGRSRS